MKLFSEDVLDFIEEHAGGHGISIQRGFNDKGGPYWSVRGAGVDAGGWPTMNKALMEWMETVKFDKARRAQDS